MNTPSAVTMTPAELTALAEHILGTHHALLHRELPRLDAALSAAPRSLRAPFGHLKSLLDDHLMKEERILFPAIFALCGGEGAHGCGLFGPIQQMQHEHEQIRLLETALREAARDAGPLEADLLALLDDLNVHAETEDTLLFPAAVALERAALGGDDEEAPAPTVPDGDELVRETRGACSTCLADVPAAVRIRHGEALLVKHCPEHGETTQLLSRHGAEWAELDRFFFQVNSDARPQRDYIVRMTERCNLACPICLAKANTQDTPDLPLSGLEELLSARRGLKIDLMAAEPTLREDLLDWVRRVKAAGHTAALHTNGLKLANRSFVRALKEAGVSEVFLQFDGLNEQANVTLRGRPLLKARLAALKNLREIGVAVSLIVVIGKDINEEQVGETLRFALQPENSHIREVFYLGLRSLGSARASGDFVGQALMPDEVLDLLCAQEPAVRRQDVRDFNKIYFTMLSAMRVRKCLYVQHYLLSRDGKGGYKPISEALDLSRLAAACDRYADRAQSSPHLARAALIPSFIRQGLRPQALPLAPDLLRLESLFARGFNLEEVPSRFLLLGFITACDPDNYDQMVSAGCGKGELSADGGFVESGADANVARERRFV